MLVASVNFHSCDNLTLMNPHLVNYCNNTKHKNNLFSPKTHSAHSSAANWAMLRMPSRHALRHITHQDFPESNCESPMPNINTARSNPPMIMNTTQQCFEIYISLSTFSPLRALFKWIHCCSLLSTCLVNGVFSVKYTWRLNEKKTGCMKPLTILLFILLQYFFMSRERIMLRVTAEAPAWITFPH